MSTYEEAKKKSDCCLSEYYIKVERQKDDPWFPTWENQNEKFFYYCKECGKKCNLTGLKAKDDNYR